MNCRWVFWLDPVFLLLVLDNLVSLNHEIAAGEHIDWVYRAALRPGGGGSYTQGRGWDPWSPFYCLQRCGSIGGGTGEALGFAILRDGVVIPFVAATSSALKKTGQGRAAQNQVGSRRCCAVFLGSLSLQQIHWQILTQMFDFPPLLAKKICMWPRRKEDILLPSTCVSRGYLLQGCAVGLVKEMEISQHAVVSHSGSDAHTLHRTASVRTTGMVESERTNVPSHMFHLKEAAPT